MSDAPETGHVDAEPVVLAPGVVQIDTLLGGWKRMTAGYLVEGPAPVLVETGSQSSVGVLLAALDRLGVGPSDLAGIAVTHIHLDHAGGVAGRRTPASGSRTPTASPANRIPLTESHSAMWCLACPGESMAVRTRSGPMRTSSLSRRTWSRSAGVGSRRP